MIHTYQISTQFFFFFGLYQIMTQPFFAWSLGAYVPVLRYPSRGDVLQLHLRHAGLCQERLGRQAAAQEGHGRHVAGYVVLLSITCICTRGSE